jgi:molybdopterin synthase sulfur carrier subunit
MSITVRIPSPLRRITKGEGEVNLQCETLAQCIDGLEARFPGIRERLCDEEGELRFFVNIYLNGEDIRFLNGLQTAVASGDEVSIVPAVAGGNS